MPNFKKWLKNYVCTSNCKGICFFVGRGRMFIHFLRSKDIALIARRSLVHLKKMEFRKKQHSGKKHNIKGEHSTCTQRTRVFSTRLRDGACLLSHFLLTLFSVQYKLNKESGKAKQTATHEISAMRPSNTASLSFVTTAIYWLLSILVSSHSHDWTLWSAGTYEHPHILTRAVLWHCSTFCSCLVQWLGHFSDTEHIQTLSPC